LDNVVTRTYRYCTTGFAVWKPNGMEAMTTARHCGTDMDWASPLSDAFVGHTGAGQCGIDTALLTGANYGPHIFVGPWDSSTGRTVVGYGNPADESYVFVSGSWQGASTVRVKSVGQYVDIYGCRVGPGFWTRDEELDGSVGTGDSGGPVAGATSGPITDTIARGEIELIDANTVTACVGRQSTACGYRAFHINISAILNQLDATLQTG
jgi:hypothetical protein